MIVSTNCIYVYDNNKATVVPEICTKEQQLQNIQSSRRRQRIPLIANIFLVLVPDTLLSFTLWNHFNCSEYHTFHCLSSESKHLYPWKLWRMMENSDYQVVEVKLWRVSIISLVNVLIYNMLLQVQALVNKLKSSHKGTWT